MPAREGSLHSSTLLTPPQTPTIPKDAPFKPKHDDNISLSMKRRHTRDQHNDNTPPPRACVSDADLRNSPPRGPPLRRERSRSVPDLRGSRTFPISKAIPPAKTTGSGSADPRRRRWTLPSKASSTTYLAPTALTVPILSKAKEKKHATKESDSPAMITLRRATTAKTSPRQMSLTFFPEPTFQRSRSGFLSSFLGTITRSEAKSNIDIVDIYQQENSTRRSSRSASVDSGKAQPSSSERAPTVCTEITGVEPRLSFPGQASSDPAFRRCSTRFISAGSVYEVIWDENGSSTSSDTPPPQPITSQRRRSVAVEQLQSQLYKAEAQSRRESLAAQPSLNTPSSMPERPDQSREPSFGQLFAYKLSQSASDSFIHHLPRAQASRGTSLGNLVVPEEESEDGQPARTVEFFPPLRSRATTDASKTSPGHTVDASSSDPPSAHRTTPARQSPPRTSSQAGGLGSMVGVSTHMRRTSAAPGHWFARRRSNALDGIASRKQSAFTQSRMGSVVEDDTTPLLSRVGMLNRWNS